jgi:hypothetical protein
LPRAFEAATAAVSVSCPAGLERNFGGNDKGGRTTTANSSGEDFSEPIARLKSEQAEKIKRKLPSKVKACNCEDKLRYRFVFLMTSHLLLAP